MSEDGLLPRFKSFSTDAIHAGQHPDPHHGAVIPPISLSTTYAQKSPGVGYPAGFEYTRSHGPTRNAWEANVAALEKGKHGIAFASGLAAIGAIITTLKAGDHVVSEEDVYGGTGRYFRKIATRGGITFDFVDMNDHKAVEAAIKPETKLMWLETPTNPTLKVVDIKALCDLAHKHDVKVCCDNTFLSPYFQRPLTLGADMVLHSVSKYLNGHSDVIGGIVVTSDDDLNSELRYVQNGMGAVQAPFDSWLAMRGTKTLAVRMAQHERNAKRVAAFLDEHDKVDRVTYPGLKSHPSYDVVLRQQTGFGGMITFYLKGGLEQARAFLENLKVATLAESLGGVETLIEHPAIMTHASVPAEVRAKLGIGDTMIRMSVGIEDVEDLLDDLANALKAVPEA